MRVPRIGELDRQRADLGLIERRQDLFERDVVDVRPFPIAVADMQPHAVGRNALDALVDHRHMQLARLDEVGVGAVAIEHGAVHGEIGRIDLQHQPGLVDRLIFVAHLARDRGEIGFVGIVEGVEHGGGDDAGRGRGHERLRKRLAFAGDALVERNLALDGRRIVIVNFALRLRRVLLPAHIRKAAREIADELGKFLEFAPAPPFRFAAEAGHALRYVGLKTDALLLAVIADIDAGLFLFGDHVPDRLFHFRVEQHLVVSFARFALHQKLA